MPITIVGTAGGTALNGATSIAIDLPVCLENDIVVVTVSAIGTSQNVGVSTAGYTELFDRVIDGISSYDINQSVSWKRMGATPDTTVDCTCITDTSRGASARVAIFRGVDLVTAIDVPYQWAGTYSSAQPNAPTITPITPGSIVVATGSCDANGWSSVVAPSGYTDLGRSTADDLYDNSTVMACKIWNRTGDEDPAPWTGFTDIHVSCASTFALRPAVPGLVLTCTTSISTSSPAIAITGTTAILWEPTDTDLWLDAADADTITIDTGVSEWADKSGNSRHAVQATGSLQPIINTGALNEKNTITFDGAGDLMSLASQPFVGTTPRSVFCVVQQNTFAQGMAIFAGVSTSDTTSGGVFDICPESGQLAVRVSGNALFATTIPTTAVQWGVTWGSGTVFNTLVYKDGASVNRTGGSDATINTLAGTAQIGYALRQLGPTFDGDVAEVVIFDTVLSTDDREKIEGYLAWKWGLEANLPVGHPYESAAPSDLLHAIAVNCTTSTSTSTPELEAGLTATCAVATSASTPELSTVNLITASCDVNTTTSNIAAFILLTIAGECLIETVTSDIVQSMSRSLTASCYIETESSTPHMTAVLEMAGNCSTEITSSTPDISVTDLLTADCATTTSSSEIATGILTSLSASCPTVTSTTEVALETIRKIVATCELETLTDTVMMKVKKAAKPDDWELTTSCEIETTTVFVALENTTNLDADCGVLTDTSSPVLAASSNLSVDCDVVVSTNLPYLTTLMELEATCGVSTTTSTPALISYGWLQADCSIETSTTQPLIAISEFLVADCDIETSSSGASLFVDVNLTALCSIETESSTNPLDIGTTLSTSPSIETSTSVPNLRISDNVELGSNCGINTSTSLVGVTVRWIYELASDCSIETSTASPLLGIRVDLEATIGIETTTTAVSASMTASLAGTCGINTSTSLIASSITVDLRPVCAIATDTSTSAVNILRTFNPSCAVIVETNAWILDVVGALTSLGAECTINTSTNLITINITWEAFPDAEDCEWYLVQNNLIIENATDDLSLVDTTESLTLSGIN